MPTHENDRTEQNMGTTWAQGPDGILKMMGQRATEILRMWKVRRRGVFYGCVVVMMTRVSLFLLAFSLLFLVLSFLLILQTMTDTQTNYISKPGCPPQLACFCLFEGIARSLIAAAHFRIGRFTPCSDSMPLSVCASSITFKKKHKQPL